MDRPATTMARIRSGTRVAGMASIMSRAVDALERARYDEAASLFQHAAQLEPESALAWLGVGVSCTRILRTDEAEDALQRAAQLAPDDFFARFRLGELYLRIGLAAQAREALERAMDLSRDSEQRRMVRELLAVDDRRAARRVWRPDFAKLLGRKRSQ
ncbi:MAG: tetratricopeptide repeat protein [Candidatus Binataceae bacterium]